MESRLPAVTARFLRFICPEELIEEIEGDLIQRYSRDEKSLGMRRAKARLWWNAVRFARPGIFLRNKFRISLNSLYMLRSHFKFAVRAFMKDKFFSGLNILGLALAISVSMILLLILQQDFSYDLHYANHDRIYRLGNRFESSDGDWNSGATARELADILRETYPEIEKMTRIGKLGRTLVKEETGKAGRAFYETNVIQADSAYFSVFKHTFIAGDENTCLNDPDNAVVTESTALKYFNTTDVLGQTLLVDQKVRKITGVIADLPANTHLRFEFLLSGLPEIRPTWDHTFENGKPVSLVFWNPDVYTYMVLPANYDPNRFYHRFEPIYDKYFKEVGDQSASHCSPFLQPLAEIHFSDASDDWTHGNLTNLFAFSGIGLMIILLASVNYMNLSTAKATRRATEIAIKKVVGVQRGQLALSFIVESTLLSFFSLALAVGLVFWIVNFSSFKELTGKEITLDFFNNPTLLIGSLGIATCIGLISGLYPAFYLPAIPAVTALKGKFRNSPSSHLFRKGLITTQFVISISVVVCTVLMSKQIIYMQEQDLGFNKDNVLVIPIHDESVRKKIDALKTELLRDTRIESVTGSASIPGLSIGGNVMFGEGENGMQQRGGILGHFVGDDYLKSMGVPLIAGRDFRPGEDIDEDGMYIANEAVVELMGWGDNALGKKVTFWEGMNPGVVIGVVKNFHASSLHQQVEPMFIVKGHWDSGFLQIRLTGNDLQGVIGSVKDKWSKVDPSRPFEYFFLDERFNEQYKEDITQNKLLSSLSAICIFISLLGVVGLAAFSATQRTKEIGVRKVLGANIPDIILLLSRDVLVLVAISAVIALPISGMVMLKWLEDFAYRAELSYITYGVITFVALSSVFVVILLQSLRVARTNPVDSLKYE